MYLNLLNLWPYLAGILFIYLYLKFQYRELAKEILWATLRTSIQLILLAFALEQIFKSQLFITSLAISLIMTINSSGQIVRRSKRKILNLFWISLISNIFAIWPLAALFSMDLSLGSWTEPQRILPLLGMLLGNTLSGVSIGISNFMENFGEKKNEVITMMALGATIEEASHRFFYRALKAGINPQINSMISMGIISIPGMMAGQLISNINAMDASILQIKMMLSICIGTLISIIIALKFVRKSLFLSTGELCS